MSKTKIRITDVTLRDGMHAVSHKFSVEDAKEIAAALDQTGVTLIEAAHGDGLGGSSIQYGLAKESEADFLRAVCENVRNTKIAALLIPGIGTVEDLKKAVNCGIQAVRVATHCTEADISEQHILEGRNMGLEVTGFLMMSHMVTADVLVEEAKKMESYGAQTVYVVDSAGAMLMDEVRSKVSTLRNQLNEDVEIGFHAHNNLGLSIANSLVAIKEGATRIDASLAGLGAGAGNTPIEVFAAVAEKEGTIETGLHVYRLMDAAENIVRPRMIRPIEIDRLSLTMGYCGVYSSFLLHAFRVAEQFKVDPRDVLAELGRRKVVGGQEDMIVDVAVEIMNR
jgi:4-hydroxy 2-oxovalerate aldolase/4-hydroxy-2-oxovalerate/4-hydroxy-2-oxohexanoate aldolase